MRKLSIYLFISVFLFAGIACTSGENSTEDDNVKIEGFVAQLGERETGRQGTRAAGEFSVNGDKDPTFDTDRLTGTGGWVLNVQLLDKNNDDTPAGTADCTYNGTAWIPETDLYFASYRSPQILAQLAPAGWTEINITQNTASDLLLQDILVEASTPYSVRPSHNPTLTLRHGNSMLDFKLSGVNPDDIIFLDVSAGGKNYKPYKVPGTDDPEYLVILPVGTTNPVVQITTKGGANYRQTIGISSTEINRCYCAELVGVELLLTSVTIVDWSYGTALAGSYTTVTSYPTFRGTPNSTAMVYYDNGLEQRLEFDDRGEYTGRPFGRTITRINDYTLTTPLILGTMYIDLRDYV